MVTWADAMSPCRLGEQQRFSKSGKRLLFKPDCVRVTVGGTLCFKEAGNPSQLWTGDKIQKHFGLKQEEVYLMAQD